MEDKNNTVDLPDEMDDDSQAGGGASLERKISPGCSRPASKAPRKAR